MSCFDTPMTPEQCELKRTHAQLTNDRDVLWLLLTVDSLREKIAVLERHERPRKLSDVAPTELLHGDFERANPLHK